MFLREYVRTYNINGPWSLLNLVHFIGALKEYNECNIMNEFKLRRQQQNINTEVKFIKISFFVTCI